MRHPDMKTPKRPPISGPGSGKSGPGKSGRAGEPKAFDLWLERGLHKIFDNVANEPIPDEWLKLIEEDRQK